MINQQILQGNWNEVKGKIRSKWGQITNDDIQNFSGNVDQLLGLIQRKTGEGRESIERFLDEAASSSASAIENVADSVREYANDAGAKIQQGAKQASESVRQGYENAEQVVRRHPAESAVVCFGAGVLAGLVLALMVHQK